MITTIHLIELLFPKLLFLLLVLFFCHNSVVLN